MEKFRSWSLRVLTLIFVSATLGCTGCDITDDGAGERLTNIQKIKKLPCEATSNDNVLTISSTKDSFNNDSLKELATLVDEFESIDNLDLSGSSVDHEGFVHIAKLPKIESLDLSGRVDSKGLEKIGTLKDVIVSDLYLNDNDLVDDDLDHLEALENLEFLSLSGNDQVKNERIEELKEKIDDLDVER